MNLSSHTPFSSNTSGSATGTASRQGSFVGVSGTTTPHTGVVPAQLTASTVPFSGQNSFTNIPFSQSSSSISSRTQSPIPPPVPPPIPMIGFKRDPADLPLNDLNSSNSDNFYANDLSFKSSNAAMNPMFVNQNIGQGQRERERESGDGGWNESDDDLYGQTQGAPGAFLCLLFVSVFTCLCMFICLNVCARLSVCLSVCVCVCPLSPSHSLPFSSSRS
jgi:hypothetical protein